VDLDGDGHRDVVSGSYPGEIYLFAGDGEGGFLKGAKLADAEGKEIEVGRATVVFAVDWEGDGDLDLLVGDIEGRVSLLANGSGGKGLALGGPTRLTVEGAEIRAPGRNSGPVVADWDGDGRHDLVLGCGDGSVLFFRNTAEKGAPTLAKPVQIVGTSKTWPMGEGAKTSPCGNRAKLAVFDWNGDGKRDLLLGDFTSKKPEPRALTPEQQKRLNELTAERDKVGSELRKLWLAKRPEFEKAAREALGLDQTTPLAKLLAKLTKEKRQEYHRKQNEIAMADPEYKALSERSSEIYAELGELQGRPSMHGYVWLFPGR
jgi:hypothetical protein